MLLECVPNFSEGRKPEVIEAIAATIRAVTGVDLLGIDSSHSANRTVMTFAGVPEAVVEAAFRAMQEARDAIDMRTHQGAHPRIGATDVCPLVPLRGMSIVETLPYAEVLAERVGRELETPVYLYEHSARVPARRNLADIRKGQYEGLTKKLKDPSWRPDFGPAVFRAKQGATVIGVREILIAYNINLQGKATRPARLIASRLRESGYQTGTGRVSGRFAGLKAIGWHMAALGCSQVSTNITRPRETALHDVFTAAREMAENLGTTVTGSELIGLLPRNVLRNAGRFFLGNAARNMEDRQLLRKAVKCLGLASVKPFDLDRHVLEHALALEYDLLNF